MVYFEKKSMKIVLVLTTSLVALVAGLMFSYACSVNPGLRKLPDTQYLQAMQEINRAILNPWFLTCFVGPLILYAMSAWLTYRSEGAGTVFILICISGVIYLFGVFMVTGMKNVPLNEMLDKIVLNAHSSKAHEDFRKAFEGPWNSFHMTRTLASIVALILMLLALVRVR